jgi:hypothetical protein
MSHLTYTTQATLVIPGEPDTQVTVPVIIRNTKRAIERFEKSFPHAKRTAGQFPLDGGR